MKRNRKRLPAFLLAVMLCLSLLPVTAWAVETFPSKFYASVNYDYSSYSKSEIFGTVTRSSSGLTYTVCGEKTDRVVYGMEYAGGAFYTVEGTKLNHNADDGFRELRMYNSDLTSYRTIGTVNQKNANYWIVDTAMDLSGEEPALYGTYNQAFEISGSLTAFTTVCSIDLTDGHTSNWLQVTGLSSTSDIIYAMAFDEEGTLYAIGADAGEDGGPATLYTIDLDNVQNGSFGSQTVSAQKVAEIKSPTNYAISTNYIQDLGFDHDKDTLYWAENAENVLYTLDTETAVATEVGKLPALQSFCIPYDDAFEQNKHMISVICEGAGTVTGGSENKPFYMVSSGDSLTLTITPDAGSGLRYVKVDGQSISVDGLTEYTFSNVTENHVVEVAFKVPIPATQKTVTWLHYQGEPAKFYTVDNVYKFYDLPYLDQDVPREDYVQTLLDEDGNPINDDEIILPGNYDVHVTHPGNDKYAALDEVYDDALQLAKCPGTPGRPVVYGKVGCTQGDLTTISALQDYYGTDGKLIDAAHDEIPVTLVWQNPETRYDTAGNFNANATIYAAQNLDQRLKDCYNLDDGTTPLTEGCLISSRSTQVVVLPADEASLIKVQTSDASGGTVSGQGVYKNSDSVTVTATANTDYTFQGWQEDGSVVSNDATYTFNASGDRTLTALFKPPEKEYYVALSVDPVGAGTVTGSGSYKDVPHQATVNATAKAGYYFIGWYDGSNQKSTEANYTFTVKKNGITLTAKFGVDYLIQAEQAKTSFANALENDTLSWATLNDAVDAYEAAKTFVENPPSGVEDAEERFDALTTYYNSVQTLDLSNQNIDSADLAKLALFTGVTDLNLSGNTGVTSLSNLTCMTQLATLDLSGTGVTDLSSLSSLTKLETLDISGTGVTAFDALVNENGQLVLSSLETLTAKNLTLTSLSALAEVVGAEGFSADRVTLWDFTDSTLPPKDENRADVETIQAKLNNKFLPPTIPENTYIISASPETLNFGSVYSNYTQPAAQTVTIKNTGNQTVTLVQPTSEHYILGNLSAKELAPNGTATFTVQPKPDLDANTYNEALTVTGSSGDKTVKATVQLQFEVKQQTGGGGGGGGVATYTVTVGNAEHGKVTASPTRAGSGSTVTLTVKPDQGYALDTLTATDAKGNEVKLTDKGNGTYTFTMPASKVKIAASFKESAEQVTNPFTDVFEGDYYYDAVLWAVEQGVTNGTSATTFSPNVTVTRAQMVTFLWRAHGAPAAAGSNPFADVSRDAYYYDAVLWAAANGVTNGTSAAAFSPDAPVTRAQAVTFQWRAHGAPEAAGDSFGDVPADAYYSQAVAWAAANGITNGTGADTFSPEAAVSRAQAVTFLWRELA